MLHQRLQAAQRRVEVHLPAVARLPDTEVVQHLSDEIPREFARLRHLRVLAEHSKPASYSDTSIACPRPVRCLPINAPTMRCAAMNAAKFDAKGSGLNSGVCARNPSGARISLVEVEPTPLTDRTSELTHGRLLHLGRMWFTTLTDAGLQHLKVLAAYSHTASSSLVGQEGSRRDGSGRDDVPRCGKGHRVPGPGTGRTPLVIPHGAC